ncbi:DUF1684 domain-containing protein [Mucilaginibacter terrae]|uniref:Uncharacterized protein (DUF1684 family) n=1 Tax=Mucilaginibacter terrae TaxID=1955052 RepID=A0ABU3GWI0_9SPHI|nr:DUF1684 domain-containing protein [Mucilaginibacter terrae]MDT3403342.1 uncharacterized protein (DUF1684 family) [Mucilaginibacter terrae]
MGNTLKACITLFMLMAVYSTSYSQSHKQEITAFRKHYIEDFLKNKSSPLKEDDLKYLRFFEPDSSFRVEAKVELVSNAGVFTIPAISGGGSEYTKYAVLSFTIKGKVMTLEVYRNAALSRMPLYADYLFLPFTDETNGKETYGNGRYIDLREGDFKNNKLTLDFNKAYNPYCAFASGYACPKPPQANNLHVAIEAGEKNFAKGH